MFFGMVPLAFKLMVNVLQVFGTSMLLTVYAIASVTSILVSQAAAACAGADNNSGLVMASETSNFFINMIGFFHKSELNIAALAMNIYFWLSCTQTGFIKDFA